MTVKRPNKRQRLSTLPATLAFNDYSDYEGAPESSDFRALPHRLSTLRLCLSDFGAGRRTPGSCSRSNRSKAAQLLNKYYLDWERDWEWDWDLHLVRLGCHWLFLVYLGFPRLRLAALGSPSSSYFAAAVHGSSHTGPPVQASYWQPRSLHNPFPPAPLRHNTGKVHSGLLFPVVHPTKGQLFAVLLQIAEKSILFFLAYFRPLIHPPGGCRGPILRRWAYCPPRPHIGGTGPNWDKITGLCFLHSAPGQPPSLSIGAGCTPSPAGPRSRPA